MSSAAVVIGALMVKVNIFPAILRREITFDAVREWFFPLSPCKNSYRKGNYIVDCPDLIELLFPWSFPPTDERAIKEFGMAIGILGKG